MAQTAAFCRAQEAFQRDRAAGSQLENVRMIATKAAVAWEREALLAEHREGKRDRASALPEAASESEEDDDESFGDNSDRGQAGD